MNLSLINPYIRLAMESRISSGHNIARRVIYDYELIYLEEKLGHMKKFKAIQKSADELLKVIDSSNVDNEIRAKVRDFAESVRTNF